MILNADNGKYRFKHFMTPRVRQVSLAIFSGVESPVHEFLHRYPEKTEFCYPFKWVLLISSCRISLSVMNFW